MTNALPTKGIAYELLAPMFESWMDDDDKREFVDLTLRAVGKTEADLESEIAVGVANGHSVEEQIALCRNLLSGQE
jgi:hypothetical protein